ncbi:MAG: bifunctional oligoribonuclease/PAP phosphatase NrnA [Anaerolineae bacterium]|jgi:phosphoesterase RecJ-like protein|nr:bifunctional oligoribonuclease/PAP phosphatase NrnA [Anaerolineae bacterium]
MAMIKRTEWADATALIQSAQKIVVVTHVSPDGDAFGSMLGLVNGLLSLDKQVDCAVDDGVDDYMAFLPNSTLIQKKLTTGEWDVMISTDASDEQRTGECGAYARAHSQKVINIDHHATNTMFGDVYLVDSTAVSATEVVFRWFETMNLPLDKTIALPLLTGLVTDTMGFRTSNVTTDTLTTAQKLMNAGASLAEVTARALDTRSFDSLMIWRYALATAELHEGGVLSAELTLVDAQQVGMTEANDLGLVGFLVKVDEAMIAVVFKEVDGGKINVSMRAKQGFNVSQVAFALGGGGHVQAAGATVDGLMDDVKARVIPMLIDAAKAGTLTIG